MIFILWLFYSTVFSKAGNNRFDGYITGGIAIGTGLLTGFTVFR